MMLNAFPLEMHKTKKVKSLEVNYLYETNYGEEVQIFSKVNPDHLDDHFVNIVRKSDNREVCRARMIWI